MKIYKIIVAFCRKECTGKLGWNDRRRDCCRRMTPCKDLIKLIAKANNKET